ncbi:O-acetyl-ADP-ribose deacetylase [Treponema sp. OMZ 840]|uniref:O-acetyl-ADP-ribose deacetylase n=1 Tax=Treponema sp. OMZ 840 TaxID=244313 RepID=UPI003D8F2D9F
MPIEIVMCDITQMKVDAVVNAANTSLLGGGGVDGAIHRAAGPALLEACKKLNGCKTGDAKITDGYKLPARYIIHTPGPVYKDGKSGEADLLASCYRRCLALAAEHGCKSVAFPCISTGIYGYPKKEAAGIAFGEIRTFLHKNGDFLHVYIVCFDKESFGIYKAL